MWQQILPGLRIKLFLTVMLGVVYPLALTGISQVLFPHRANGSLVTENGRVIGSELLGQSFQQPKYFQPRPSAAGNDGYDATASGGSNFGPTSQKLADRVNASVQKFRKENPDYTAPIPADLLTASASGLDPHISPASAIAQAARISKVRGVEQADVLNIVTRYTEQPDLGILGEPRVNVLNLNRALDRDLPKK